MSKAKEFKKELKDLLAKYDACIQFTCDDSSDTHGLYGDRLVINFQGERKEVFRSDGWHIQASDL